MLLAACIGAVLVRLERSACPRQGREYYHINYRAPDQFLGIRQSCSRWPMPEIFSSISYGGEGGIRTLDGLLTHTPLAGARLRPLGHLSGQDIAPIAERRIIPARSSPGKAKGSNRLGHAASGVIDNFVDRNSRA